MEDRYIKFRNALTESTQQVLPDVDRTVKQKWMTAPILQKMNQRRLAKGDDDLYNLLHKEIKQVCIEAREARLSEQCQLIEQLDAAHKTNLMYCQLKEVTGKKRGNGTTTCVEAKYGTIIMEKDKILDRWSEHIGKLYDDDRGEMPVITKGSISPITYQEVDVRCDKDLSEWMSIKQGVRQGCVASPHLYALYTEMIMREIEDMEIFRIGGKVVNNLRYTVMLAES